MFLNLSIAPFLLTKPMPVILNYSKKVTKNQKAESGAKKMNITQSAIAIRTTARCQMIDITGEIEGRLRKSGLSEGIITVYCPHTTAAVTINENADPDVVHDILLTLEQLVPHRRAGYRHTEGNSDAHVKSSLVGCSAQIPFSDGKLSLGTWQAVFFCEFDGPRNRTLQIQITGQ